MYYSGDLLFAYTVTKPNELYIQFVVYIHFNLLFLKTPMCRFNAVEIYVSKSVILVLISRIRCEQPHQNPRIYIRGFIFLLFILTKMIYGV